MTRIDELKQLRDVMLLARCETKKKIFAYIMTTETEGPLHQNPIVESNTEKPVQQASNKNPTKNLSNSNSQDP